MRHAPPKFGVEIVIEYNRRLRRIGSATNQGVLASSTKVVNGDFVSCGGSVAHVDAPCGCGA
ncbi:MAG TPA: hypothetical protein VJ837_06590 [Candidatus Paceibacterota bacterium]|nr:hypothetical protein [Candidatus Paceibacterota bacterium]